MRDWYVVKLLSACAVLALLVTGLVLLITGVPIPFIAALICAPFLVGIPVIMVILDLS